MREFWVSSGHHLTQRLPGGGLAVTDELLLAYLARPELLPPEDACAAERDVHAALLRDPRRAVSPSAIEALADPDARENWAFMLAFRERLLRARSVEAAYLDFVRDARNPVPPLFLNQLAHLVLRNALEGCQDPYVLRAAELFFRPQRVSFHEGSVLLADAEIIELAENARGPAPLLDMFGREPVTELDILRDENAWTYWSRSDAFTMALDIGSNPKSREGLARAVEAWVRHLLNVDVAVEPVARVEDRDWRWFVGLDAEATRVGNALWAGEEVAEEAMGRVLALFRLLFRDPQEADPRLGDRPVYLLLAMTPQKLVRVKPQNIVAGLPLRSPGPLP
jgi:hypothetical protein